MRKFYVKRSAREGRRKREIVKTMDEMIELRAKGSEIE